MHTHTYVSCRCITIAAYTHSCARQTRCRWPRGGRGRRLAPLLGSTIVSHLPPALTSPGLTVHLPQIPFDICREMDATGCPLPRRITHPTPAMSPTSVSSVLRLVSAFLNVAVIFVCPTVLSILIHPLTMSLTTEPGFHTQHLLLIHDLTDERWLSRKQLVPEHQEWPSFRIR